MKNIRAAARTAAAFLGLPFFVGAVALQAAVVGPLTGDTTTIPKFLYNGLRKLLGYKIEFNKASAPLEKDRPAWFVSNHLSIADFVVLGSTLKGTFGGKGEVLKWPGIAQMARAVNYMGFRRSSEYNDESRGKLVNNFNAGHNAIMFPEGTTTDGSRVGLFRGALPSLLYGEKAVDKKKQEVKLEKNVVVQPVAIRVKSVNGQDAQGNSALRDLYAMYDEDNTLRRLWKRLQLRETTIELTAFPPLDPRDYTDSKALMNAAAEQIVSVVNPGQQGFEKARIPV